MLRAWTTYTRPKALAKGVVRELPLAVRAEAVASQKPIAEWAEYANFRDANAFDNLIADVWDSCFARQLQYGNSGNGYLVNVSVLRSKSPRFDCKQYRYTGTVSWCGNWYTKTQGKCRDSRTARRRKGGWKRKPLAQRHDAPD